MIKSAILYFSGDAKVRVVAQYHAPLLHGEFVTWRTNDKLVGDLDKVVIKYTYKINIVERFCGKYYCIYIVNIYIVNILVYILILISYTAFIFKSMLF